MSDEYNKGFFGNKLTGDTYGEQQGIDARDKYRAERDARERVDTSYRSESPGWTASGTSIPSGSGGDGATRSQPDPPATLRSTVKGAAIAGCMLGFLYAALVAVPNTGHEEAYLLWTVVGCISGAIAGIPLYGLLLLLRGLAIVLAWLFRTAITIAAIGLLGYWLLQYATPG